LNLCECGCKQVVKNRFVSGHNFKVKPTILFGEKNGFYGKTHTEDNKRKCLVPLIGRKQSGEEKAKRVESNRKTRNERYGKWLSDNAIEKIRVSNTDKTHSEDTKEKIRQNNLNRPKEVNQKIRESVKVLWKNEEYRNRQVKAHAGKQRSEESLKKWAKSIGLKPNKLEADFNIILQTNFPNEWKYVGDGYTWIAGKCPDWININGKKKLIELFGNYFHNAEDEEVRKSHFKKYGFDTLVIWEKEFRKNPEEVIEKIQQF